VFEWLITLKKRENPKKCKFEFFWEISYLQSNNILLNQVMVCIQFIF